MPIYEYRCSQCGKIQEKIVFPGEKETTTTCECGSETNKIVSRPGVFNLVGAGFHQNDYDPYAGDLHPGKD